ncbi:MAG TPA: hypothetical protein VN682_04360, partial [Terriglobales bacterium]|nr:hypothetical protein [Terriglobales bacterium]
AQNSQTVENSRELAGNFWISFQPAAIRELIVILVGFERLAGKLAGISPAGFTGKRLTPYIPFTPGLPFPAR